MRTRAGDEERIVPDRDQHPAARRRRRALANGLDPAVDARAQGARLRLASDLPAGFGDRRQRAGEGRRVEGDDLGCRAPPSRACSPRPASLAAVNSTRHAELHEALGVRCIVRRRSSAGRASTGGQSTKSPTATMRSADSELDQRLRSGGRHHRDALALRARLHRRDRRRAAARSSRHAEHGHDDPGGAGRSARPDRDHPHRCSIPCMRLRQEALRSRPARNPSPGAG